MSALLPCPFCGGAARLVKWIRPEKWVDCTECEAEGPVADTPEGAIAAWNRRVPAYPSEQEIDAAQREQDRNGELWAILFHDTDMPPAVFHGEGAEEAARRKYHAVRSTYNCVLMAPASIRRAPNADARAAEAAMRERAAKVPDEYEPRQVVGDGGGRENESVYSATGNVAAAIRALPLTGDGGRDGVA